MRIRIRNPEILGLPDPDLLVKVTDPDPSIINQIRKIFISTVL
jgi:hypothetical protein